MAEHDHADDDAERHADQPRRDEASRCVRDDDPGAQQRKKVRGVTAERDSAFVGELADRREDDDGDCAGECELPKAV